MSIPLWFVMAIFSFLLTYLIHSTVIIGVIALCVRRIQALQVDESRRDDQAARINHFRSAQRHLGYGFNLPPFDAEMPNTIRISCARRG